jgi:hypothetical protein
MARSDISIIDQVSKDCSEMIVSAIESLSEFYAGKPELVTKFNREVFNKLTPASQMLLEDKYGKEFVAAWKIKMEQGG